MRVAIIRGKFLNRYEMQNYEPLISKVNFTGLSSHNPLQDNYQFPLVKLFSPMDLPDFLFKMPILNRLFGDAQVLFSLEKKLKGFDVAHCAETYYYYTQQCLNAKKKGYVKKIVSTVWENIPFNNEGIRLRKGFKQRAIKEVDKFICVTETAKETLIKEGCEKRKIIVIYPGVDLEQFKAKSLKRKAGDKDLTILFVGRLVKEKGIWDLLEAYKKITSNNKHLTIRLKIIGDGKEKSKILNKIKDWGLEKQVEIKKVDYKNLPEVYQEADIFVLPSKKTKYWSEQFGMVLIEAMASSLPIIGSNSGSIPEVIGDSGLIFKENDREDLTKQLLKLINNKTLREELGKKARARAEKYFDCKKQAEKIYSVYKNLS